MKKHGITVDCERCVYNASKDRGVFDITVPIADSETGVSGPAKLRCGAFPEGHTVDLLEWQGLGQRDDRSAAGLQQRISATLAVFAERRICGNRNICPSEVVRIVEENSAS